MNENEGNTAQEEKSDRKIKIYTLQTILTDVI